MGKVGVKVSLILVVGDGCMPTLWQLGPYVRELPLMAYEAAYRRRGRL
jgi:hypothetical protein